MGWINRLLKKDEEMMSEGESILKELRPPNTKEMTKILLKYVSEETASNVSDLANLFTLGIPKMMLEKHVQKKIMENDFPHLTSKPLKYQYWYNLRLSMPEYEVGRLLGLPTSTDAIDIKQKRKQDWEYKYDNSWAYKRGVIYFKNEIVVAFFYKNSSNNNVKKGFPIRKQTKNAT